MSSFLVSQKNENTLASCFRFFVIFDDNKAKIVGNNKFEFGLRRCLYSHFGISVKRLDHFIFHFVVSSTISPYFGRV